MRTPWPERPLLCLIVAAVALAPGPDMARAARDPAALCERATQQAAEKTGVPLNLLQAVALAESGRPTGGRQRPWPWTVNFGGQGQWFDTSGEAELAVEERRALGATNIDIGCFQINHRWHGQAFPNVAAMLDPEANALYAAEFLARLYQETGSWPDAVAAYHSRTPELAETYLARVEGLSGEVSPPGTAVPEPPRENRFPLLRSGALGSLGSLVPQVSGGPGLLAATP